MPRKPLQILCPHVLFEAFSCEENDVGLSGDNEDVAATESLRNELPLQQQVREKQRVSKGRSRYNFEVHDTTVHPNQGERVAMSAGFLVVLYMNLFKYSM